jgi:uncharacterized membrane protein/glutaredoxin
MTASSTKRRRQLPWIHRHARTLLAGVAGVGLLLTGYLTVVKLTGNEVSCPIEGCDRVLNSPYAQVFGLPLSLFGMGAYLVMMVMALAPIAIGEAQKARHTQVEEWTGLFLVVGGSSMAVFSSYLMYLLTSEIQVACVYCVVSAVLSFALFGLALAGRRWDDWGKPLFTALVVAMVTLIGTLALYATPADQGTESLFPITTTSGPSEIALAKHLRESGAQEFGAYWCPHCHEQKELFGKEAAKELPYVECDPNGRRAQPEVCQKAGVRSFPSWQVGGKLYQGVMPLDRLADLSGYNGDRTFRNLPTRPLPTPLSPATP